MADASRPDTAAYRKAVIGSLIALVVVGTIGVVIGNATSGRDGVLTAALGIGVAAVFSLSTSVAAWRGSRGGPTAFVAVMSVTWVLKIVAVIVAVIVAQHQEWLVRPLFGAMVLAGAMAALAIDVRAVATARIPYV